jgi:hypothetical protein
LLCSARQLDVELAAGANDSALCNSLKDRYTFRRQHGLLKVGFAVDLSTPPAPVTPGYPVTALPAK